jgi:putative FmdB family regulatory protein
MPVYEYTCTACGAAFQRLFMNPDDRPDEIVCTECGSTDVQRIFSAPKVHAGSEESLVDQVASEENDRQQASPRRGTAQAEVDDLLRST